MSVPAPSLANDADVAPPISREQAQALLRMGYARFEKKLLELLAAALEVTDDLFETTSAIPDADVAAFRQLRPEWLARFRSTLDELFTRRLAGNRRKGLRPDAEASAAALRVLTPFDHEKQASLTGAARFLTRFTQRELAALDLRIGMLLEDVAARDLDNPFSVPYVLDALGSTSRAVYPNPRIWRPLMERLLTDLTPNFNGLYIALNGMLADHGVLPEIKATLRARSDHRPSDDRDLLATFTQLLHDVAPPMPDIAVPDMTPEPGAAPALRFDKVAPGAQVSPEVLAGLAAMASGTAPPPEPAWMAALKFHDRPAVPTETQAPRAPQMAPSEILSGLAALASLGAPGGSGAGASAPAAGAGTASVVPAQADNDFPSLDPLMALGTSNSLFSMLAQWQKLDLPAAIARLAPPTAEGAAGSAVVPLNLIPHIRAAIAGQITNPADAITVDVIGLLFDYIFRDPAIAPSTRALFGRLQVPIVKAALLDRAFFSDKKHPARQLLDHLADAAVGAANDDAYREAFEEVAQRAIDHVCADFEIDVTVFRDADRQLLAFADAERHKAADALSENVAQALRAEEDDADRAEVRALLRDRLAGLDVPFEVRSFVETIWADYLAKLRKDDGTDSPAWDGALATLDDMLWSIVAKERTAQKAKLTKLIPTLIGGLRSGCKALAIPAERSTSFFESLYQLHMAAIKPPAPAAPETVDEAESAEAVEAAPPAPRINVHDYVGEMAVGTWLQFDRNGGAIDARLTWVSPLRAKYIFTSRSRSAAFVLSPEELAYQLGSGTARLVVEPVPLWDRAVSAALDSLAARKPAADADAGVATPALA